MDVLRRVGGSLTLYRNSVDKQYFYYLYLAISGIVMVRIPPRIYSSSHKQAHYMPIAGVGKYSRRTKWSMVKPENAAPVTRIDF